MLIKFKDGYIQGINITVDLTKYDKFRFFGVVLYVPNNFKGADTNISVVFMGTGILDEKLNIKIDFLYVSNSDQDTHKDLKSIEDYLYEYITNYGSIKEALALERMELRLNNKLVVSDLRITETKVSNNNKFSICGMLFFKDLNDDSISSSQFVSNGIYSNHSIVINSTEFIEMEDVLEKVNYKKSEEDFKKFIEEYLTSNDFIIDNIEDKLKEEEDFNDFI